MTGETATALAGGSIVSIKSLLRVRANRDSTSRNERVRGESEEFNDQFGILARRSNRSAPQSADDKACLRISETRAPNQIKLNNILAGPFADGCE